MESASCGGRSKGAPYQNRHDKVKPGCNNSEIPKLDFYHLRFQPSYLREMRFSAVIDFYDDPRPAQ